MRSYNIATVALVFALSLGATPLFGQPLIQVSPVFSREPGTDRPGNDLGSVEVGLNDVDACVAVCAANSQCNAYTLYTPPNTRSSFCWYKHSAGTAQVSPTTVSGVRLAVSTPQTASAPNQATDIALADGRRATLPVTAPRCSPGRVENPGASTIITFACGSAEVQILVSIPPLEYPPHIVLQEMASRWQPEFMSWPADQRANFLRREARTLMGGATAFFHCLTYDDVAAFEGKAYCILDQPQSQLVVAAEAPMASDAAQALQAVLSQVRIR